MYNGERWIATHGFRCAFNLHTVYKNIQTGQHAFHVDEYTGWQGYHEAKLGIHDDVDSMIVGVS
jgi:hypothetical protein